MPLGQNKWKTAKSFYDGLTLASNGDSIEQLGATTFNLDKRFKNYEIFWKYHVCPATIRPDGITFRPKVADIISVIAQRNYSIFVFSLEALDFLQEILDGRLGERNRNCYITLIFAGNALQVFTELQKALCSKPEKLEGMSDLAALLKMTIDPLPDWKKEWASDRDSASRYRNYVTHQGYFYSVLRPSTGERMVLNRDAFNTKKPYTWLQAGKDYIDDQSKWINLVDACRDIVDDTITFLDRAYERINSAMAPLLENPDYQRLWGWIDHQPVPIPSSAVSRPTGLPKAVVQGINVSASSASGVDQAQHNITSLHATHFPPGSGEQII